MRTWTEMFTGGCLGGEPTKLRFSSSARRACWRVLGALRTEFDRFAMDEYHKGRGRLLLLTGVPGAGKTTVLRRVSERLAHRRVKGFYTEEMRSGGLREGFRLVTFDGQRSVIAHIGLRIGPRVGRYRVDVAAIDHAAGTALGPGADAYLVDEIGKMECLSSGFVGAIGALLEGTAPMVATVAKRGGGLIAEVKDRADAEVWEVTPANRAVLPERVLRWLISR